MKVLRDDERFSAATVSKVEAGQTARARLVVEAPAVLEGALTWRCPGPPRPLTAKVFNQWFHQLAMVNEGRYRIEVAPGSYWVAVATDDDECAARPETSSQLELRAGQTRTEDLVLRPRPKGVEVLVLDPTGQPVHQALVTFVDAARPAEMLDLAFTDEKGVVEHGPQFREGPAAGPIQVLALKGGRSGQSAAFRMGGPRHVTVTLEGSASLELEVEGLAQGRRARVEVVSLPAFGFQDSLVVTAPTTQLDSVPLGRLHVTVRTDDAVGEGEVVLEAGQTGHLKIALVVGGAVSGRLVTKDGRPRQGWVGLLTMAGEESSTSVAVDGTGAFVLRPVPPGTWKLTVMGDGLSRVVTVQSGCTTDVGDFGPP